VRMPLADLELFSPIRTIQFPGNLAGRTYLDGMRLVAASERPDRPTAIGTTPAGALTRTTQLLARLRQTDPAEAGQRRARPDSSR
jgi:hypothetical protein